MALPSSPHNLTGPIQSIIDNLPILALQDLSDADDSCPICLMPFSSIFADSDSGAGVTKLVTCNHIFCRKDLTQWILNLHGNCPTCRHVFLEIKPPSESDEESSDGGEYIPNERDEDFDDFDDDFLDVDEFSDAPDHDDMDYFTEDGDGWEDEEGVADIDMTDTEEEGVFEGELTDAEYFTSDTASGESEDRDTLALGGDVNDEGEGDVDEEEFK